MFLFTSDCLGECFALCSTRTTDNQNVLKGKKKKKLRNVPRMLCKCQVVRLISTQIDAVFKSNIPCGNY